MTEIKNVSNNSIDATILAEKKVFALSRSVFSHHVSELEVAPSAKQFIVELNDQASGLVFDDNKLRDATYRYVAKLVDAARTLTDVESETRKAFIKLFEALFGTKNVEEALKSNNPYLMLVRAVDGNWVTKKDEKGREQTKWAPNRSSEKYSHVCRFAIEFNLTGDTLLEHFITRKSITFNRKETKQTIKPTINDIIKADREIHTTGPREVMDESEWKGVFELNPLATVPFTKQIEKAIKLHEGYLGVALVRVKDGELEILGDAGKESNDVLRLFKNQRPAVAETYWKAKEESLDVAELDPALARDVK
ncbi:hypothetical protein [Brucella rhizosphaerae]|uniref:Uncharacterized protein n=1 Tax=Brucella rhizosphaerae TaxID=571254 RepID=A0A256F8J8_9HYPH|nr:hypothetical protein [Brucella rhizosphaerae]OYR11185.1 hypothetical protein CEV32_1483 [Brucella rhizosphaerae]